MYKTVRHGENSLQYKILAQQEEGVANVKCRKSPKTVTAKLIAVIILLIIGIIASAVLVPLVLTNDFIALTGTFQKFSVSTLRRSHSGNHVVVIAKKPYGWNPLHSSPPPPRISNTTHSAAFKKSTLTSDSLPTTTTSVSTTPMKTIKTTTSESLLVKMTSQQAEVKPNMGENLPTESPNKVEEMAKPSSTVSIIQLEKSFRKGTLEGGRVTSTSEPVWFEPVKKWSFGSSENFINGMNGIVSNPVSILGSLFFVIIIIIMFFVLRKTLPKRRNSNQKETGESKEDKTRLLGSSVSSDHDEE